MFNYVMSMLTQLSKELVHAQYSPCLKLAIEVRMQRSPWCHLGELRHRNREISPCSLYDH